MNTIPVRVVAAETIAEGIRLLKLAPQDGSMLPAWEPGSHIDLHLGQGITRQYSLCGSYADTSTYEVAVKREAESRGGSKIVHEALRVGSELTISAPRNHFTMSDEAGHSLLVAGGIGITPIISMARQFHDRDHTFELLYFTRSETHTAFRDELANGPLNASCRLLFGQERDAVEETLDNALRKRRDGGHLYLCGPQPFMDTVRMVAARHGWPDDAVHLEYFAAAPSSDTEPKTSFDLKLARSDKTFTIPADRTIVDVLREHGTDVETSCEQGVCGTCVVKVLEGSPDHRDCFLTAQEHARGDCMAVCVSRSHSKLLVVDL
ncbi:Carnitine monooxygenase reductase subunit [Paraburkholderia domus]|uniref:PDR/VanB family oxidoreductase n=1 Tax=Paraburkholderia domus TaxID=2793075 RepID=UPI001913A9A3|nr:PDR/VanB family oxidoreductase [Paraburkholderia domus]MBK5091669.1 oxidoreductase [Burkholderia sp. R-69927]MBK5124855.1 oxidoreductase [Burkholderia sp. R-69980]MBK5185957.1 oxidoreductase [Burkholderia sp. R-69749]CAE6791814.1 Carnitine monooxygenase reductase subunit [Paraburkholderia domus]CAE6897821.1 Carnitine monooxygenase reductase subunit [Paraburkholderia domus]